jgi:acetyltransferase-like isoleucine patch superfamily enzyme
MIREFVTKIIKKKNPEFAFDEALDDGILFGFFFQKFWSWVRSWRLLFYGKTPRFLFLGQGVRFFNLKNIKFGKWVQLEDHVYLSAIGKLPIQLGNNVRIGAFSRLIISTSFNNIGHFIKIGNNVGLGEFAYLGGAGGLEIGDDCIIGQYFSCHPENHQFSDLKKPIRIQGVTRKGIKIGSNCWIGAKVTILDGVTIGNNCIIAAGAVVNKNMPSGSLIGGVPAKVLKMIDENEQPHVHLNLVL